MFDCQARAAGEKECDYATPDEIRDYWLARCREVIDEATKAKALLLAELRRHGAA
jgi:hypothetical protein